ncbi:uncharacterized protein cfap92 [Osmerus eperlanus]|uniref:uncharacterized protein cfap92 n=1 Tax=Osmerus eperlanus TaxID=29151 RepID=UPI002E15B67A
MEAKEVCEFSDSKGSSRESIHCHSPEFDTGVYPDNGVRDSDTENDQLDSQSEVQHMDQGIQNSLSNSHHDKSTQQVRDDSHNVTWKISIVIAIPKGEDEDHVAIEKEKKRPKKVLSSGVFEAPKAQGYYHIEYNLLPDDPEPTKVDLVMFGLAAKIYIDNEAKVLKPWHEGDQVWLGWSQSVKVRVTRELLIKLASHKVTFRVWDTKDRVSTKARNDRPKAFRLPQTRSGEETDHLGATPDCEAARYGGVKQIVYKLRSVFEKENPRTRLSSKGRGDATSIDFKNFSEMNCATAAVNSSSVKDKNLAVFRKKVPQKPTQDNAAYLENIQKNGSALVELSLLHLLTGDRSLTDCLVTCSSGVYEGLCNITVDRPLISEDLKAQLNPLVITILSASSLPSTPVPFQVLEEKCLPVYCQYRFHNLKVHRSKGREHRSNIYFKDVNVILTGLLSPGELQEFLQGPPLEIEVHDRDRKVEKPSSGPALFGTEPNDDKLSSVILVSGKRTTYNPLRAKTKQYNPYGVARLNLSGLLHGERCVKLNIPIECCRPPQLLGSERNEWEKKLTAMPGVVEGAPDHAMPMGHYLDANSQLKVQVEIACPFNMESGSEGALYSPFGRIIYIFKYNNVSVVAKLRSEIQKINAAAFQLDSQSNETIERILSSYKMTAPERGSVDLDTVTGFHMLDKQIHLFVLEGLKHKAIKRLWKTVPIKLMGSEEEQVMVLYNSDLSFSKRLYDTLDISLRPVHLHEPLEAIMRQPLVYVRDMVPHTCFQAMSRLSVLCKLRKLKDVVRNNLFPSAEMVLSMSKEFGIVPGKWEQRLIAKTQKQPEFSPMHASENTRRPLSTYNSRYIQWKQDVADKQLLSQTKDFIQVNIEEVQQASLQVKKPKVAVLVAEQAKDSAAHNYSIQTMNSTEQARELLRKEMAKEPTRRFTYSQHYHTATVDPRDVKSEMTTSDARSRSAWRTYDGFIYPGFKSSIESNEHPGHPDEARVEALRKPWRENILHENTLRPTLARDRWPWRERHQDFQIYTQTDQDFSTPVSIHLAGERLQQEQQQAAWSQYSRWRRKVLPGGSTVSGRRVPEFRCYMGGAPGQLPAKLQNLLKDGPMKYSLRKPGMALKPVPSLSVVQRSPSSERKTNIAFAPGLLQDQSLMQDNNMIPRHNSQYSKFHFRQVGKLYYERQPRNKRNREGE